MRSVDIKGLKNQFGKFLTQVKNGEEVVICEHDVPVAKMVRFSAEKTRSCTRLLGAARKRVLPSVKFNLKKFLKMPAPRVAGNKAIRVLLADREPDA